MTWRAITRALRAQGWHLEAGRRHTLIRGLDGRVVAVAGGTPSDVRSERNLLAQLRRSGLEWPWGPGAARARRRRERARAEAVALEAKRKP